MDTKNLIRFLKNDLLELTDILTNLESGSSLSEMELKLIKSRVRSLTEEFEMLESTVDSTAGKSDKIESVELQSKKNEKPALSTPDNDFDVVSANTQEQVDRIVSESKPEVAEYQVSKEMLETHEPEILELEDDDPIVELENDSVVASETLIESDWQTQNDAVEINKLPLTEINRKQTIADKYNGASDSLNDRIAAHIVQQDLASKLKQHPIENLNKAIKLNDKVWFIKELFNGNADLYKQTISTINQMADMDEALDFLERNFSFEQGKESFKSFIEFIYRRFLK